MSALSLTLATRGSALARWQTDHIAALLSARHPDLAVEVLVVETEGDRRADVPIHQLGGRGVFAKEVQQALLDGHADVAVHSAKDLTSTPPEGLVLAAIPERADPRDALVGSRLDDLATGDTVATGSVRRRAQLGNLRPDLCFAGLRGNIDTRLEKAEHFGAIVMAAAALDRLGRTPPVVERLAADVMVPQVGQGALAIECRADDAAVASLLATIEHQPSRRAVDAERAFLATLGGSCDLPVGAHAVIDSSGEIHLDGVLCALDGSRVIRHGGRGMDPAALGRTTATHLVDRMGGADLLDEVRSDLAT
ncbi:MAG TPA: hydroxymethylbilane synthase [Acidimicrobiales bacterium]